MSYALFLYISVVKSSNFSLAKIRLPGGPNTKVPENLPSLSHPFLYPLPSFSFPYAVVPLPYWQHSLAAIWGASTSSGDSPYYKLPGQIRRSTSPIFPHKRNPTGGAEKKSFPFPETFSLLTFISRETARGFFLLQLDKIN